MSMSPAKDSAKDYFALLGVMPSMQLDGQALKTAYFEAQRRYHPDKADSDTQRMAYMQRSADINTAYHTLKSPSLRLYYMLKLQGIDVLGDNAPAVAHDILMQSMEWREALEACSNGDDKAAFLQARLAEREVYLRDAGAALADNKLSAAVEAALTLRYLDKVIDEARL